MNKLLTMVVTGTMMLAAVSPVIAGGSHHGGDRGNSHGRPPPQQAYHGGNDGGHHGGNGWGVAGQILTGVLIGSIIQSACYAEPPRREVVYTRPVYQPAPVQYVQYAQAQPVAYAAPVCQPEQYVQSVVVRQNTSVTLWVQNSNGSQTPIVLRRADNGQYIGPRGECYSGFPPNEQLRQLYGM